MDLTAILAFVNARLDEREAAARAANPSPWRRITDQEPRLSSTTIFGASYPGDQEKLRNVCNVELSWERDANATHIILNDPQFVLDDVATKRRIVEAHADPKHYCAPGPIDRDGYSWYEAGEKRWADIPCLHLRLLAAPFAQHPDYDPAWAVEGTVTT